MVTEEEARDEGFGIVEALVAILLFGILSVAMVPAIIIALEVSASTTTSASAQQVAQGRVEEARTAAAGDCALFVPFVESTPSTTYTDSRGARYELTESFQVPGRTAAETEADTSWCTGDTVLVTYNVVVNSLDTGDPDIADVTTLIAVPGIG